MSYNTFNSWESYGERENRVMSVTYAVRSALAFRFPPTCSPAFTLQWHSYDHQHTMQIQNI